MITLLELRDGALPCLLPPDRDLSAWHAAITAEITQQISAAHAALFATPQRAGANWAWTAPGTEYRRFADLPAADRTKLTDAVRVILSDIRRLAESGAAPAVAAAWPALREIPDLGHLYAVDGRPVIAAWGHAGGAGSAALLARFDDRIPWRAGPGTPWLVYAATLACLALLALGAGLLLPLAGVRLAAEPAACTIPPGQLAALGDQGREAARGADLQLQLAQLTEELGRRALACPLRATPAPPVSPLPRPPSRADLPQQQWERHDLSMLDGCWTLTTAMTLMDNATRQERPMRSWRMCFGSDGHGRQEVVRADGPHCAGPLKAAFANDILRVEDPENCTGPGLTLARSSRNCRRVSDSEAECQGRNLEGPATGASYSARFRR